MSNLALELIAKEKIEKTGKLDLGNCGLTELPAELFELIWLEELMISNRYVDYGQNKLIESKNKGERNELEKLSKGFLKLIYLKELYCGGENIFQKWKITDISFLSGMTQLQSLVLSYNQITDISFLSGLTKLQSLDLINNQITDISFLSGMTQLQSLVLSSNQITDISFLSGLTKLQSLVLINNQITDISFLSGLTKLQSLDLRNNQITDYSFLSGLTQLQSLNLSSNQITDISFLSGMTQLQSLVLRNNQITDISFLSGLTQLQSLVLSYNQITDISFLSGFTQLQSLYLSYNQITDISFLSGFTQLQSLDLSSNQITDISFLLPLIELGKIQLSLEMFGSGISLYNNPIQNPPLKIVKQGNEAVINYFKQIKKQGTFPLLEAKLLIVGEAGSGKSSLMKKLVDNEYVIPKDGDKEMKSTVGIKIHEGWTFPYYKNKSIDFTTNLWDFGGQEVQYMTHQFFMTARSLYVLVANDRKQDTEFDYWFRIINLLGRENQGGCSPVLVVLNQINYSSITNFNIGEYREKYPDMLIQAEEVDLSETDGRFERVQETIQKMVCELPHIEEPLPKFWIPIRKKLIERRKTDNHITWSQFKEICESEDLNDEKDQMYFSQYLHNLGVIVHYYDDWILKDFVILNPQWSVDAVYCILSDKRVIKNHGKFTKQDLADYWKKYTIAERKNLLELMLKDHFEVCYQIPNIKSYIAPQLLSPQLPTYTWNNPTCLKFRYQYPFMPKGLIARLIVRVNEWIAVENEVSLVWKKGVVIQKDNCQARIIQKNTKDNDEVIDIEINGDIRNRKFILKMVCDEIESIHKKSFEHIPHNKMIPCDCSMCENSKMPNYHKYETLLKYANANEAEIMCSESIKKVRVLGLLEGVFNHDKMREITEQKRYGRLMIEGDENLIKDLITKPTSITNQTSFGNADNVGNNKITNNHDLAKAEEKLNIKNIKRKPLDNIDLLKEMLVDGEIVEVLEILKTKISDDKILILIKTRLQNGKSERQKGTISREGFNIEKQQITENLMDIIDEWNP
jgi:Leucine-rich repeat (LRR) protein/signal recognition particle receptor subunit beta